MKKFLSAALSLALALSLVLMPVLAEGTDSTTLPEPQELATLFPDATIVTKDFEDFTISYPDSMVLFPEAQLNDDWRQLITFFDAGNAELQIVWMNRQVTFDDTYVAAQVEETRAAWGADAEVEYNGAEATTQYTLYSSAAVDFGGHQAACIIYSFDVLSGLRSGAEVSQRIYSYSLYVPLGEKGTYIFIIAAKNLADCATLSSILHTVTWKE